MLHVCDDHLSPLTPETNQLLKDYEDAMAKKTPAPTTLLAPDTIQEATQASDTARRDLAQLKAMPITMANMAVVGEILKQVKVQYKAVKDRQDAITQPMRAAEKGVRDLFRPALTALAEAETILKEGIGRAEREHHEANRVAALVTQAHLAQGNALAAAVASSAVAPTVAVDGISTREVLEFVVTDPNLVPRELCVPDDAKIRAAIAMGYREIPGVSITVGTRVTVRTA